MTSGQLNGSQRVMLDGVISDDECRELHHLSNVSHPKKNSTEYVSSSKTSFSDGLEGRAPAGIS